MLVLTTPRVFRPSSPPPFPLLRFPHLTLNGKPLKYASNFSTPPFPAPPLSFNENRRCVICVPRFHPARLRPRIFPPPYPPTPHASLKPHHPAPPPRTPPTPTRFLEAGSTHFWRCATFVRVTLPTRRLSPRCSLRAAHPAWTKRWPTWASRDMSMHRGRFGSVPALDPRFPRCETPRGVQRRLGRRERGRGRWRALCIPCFVVRFGVLEFLTRYLRTIHT